MVLLDNAFALRRSFQATLMPSIGNDLLGLLIAQPVFPKDLCDLLSDCLKIIHD